MTNRTRRSWTTLLVGLVVAAVIAVIEVRRYDSAFDGIVVMAIIGGYVLALTVLRSRSVVDERWQLIHQRALALTAQLIAVVLVAAFVITDATGGNAAPYSWPAAVVGATYLGGVLWYRWRM
jgi:xanthine/uracil permease